MCDILATYFMYSIVSHTDNLLLLKSSEKFVELKSELHSTSRNTILGAGDLAKNVWVTYTRIYFNYSRTNVLALWSCTPAHIQQEGTQEYGVSYKLTSLSIKRVQIAICSLPYASRQIAFALSLLIVSTISSSETNTLQLLT